MFYSFSRTKVTELQNFSRKKGKGAENRENRRWPFCINTEGPATIVTDPIHMQPVIVLLASVEAYPGV